MQLKFIAALAVALLLPAGTHAQEARVVASCGTLPAAYAAGSTQYPTVDVNGKLCLQSASAPPSGTAGGDLGGTYPNPTVVSGAHLGANTVPGTALTYGTSANTPAQGGVITAGGPTGSATVVPVITYNAAGQLTAVTTATIAPARATIGGGNPSTASTTFVMGGLAGSITPQMSGNVLFSYTSLVSSSVAGDGCLVQIRYGTGTAPIAGATATGTQAGANGGVTVIPAGLFSIAMQGYVNLSKGTIYWFDSALEAQIGGTCTTNNVVITAIEE